ncbi:MAG: dihydrolipoyl dehydrogenase [Magnetococcales bacterium]|nr:dihydrolipoyl dehydrogenase [Magnetococcales bacterium]
MNDETVKAGLVVLGAGPGGYAAAFRAADMGLAVTLVDLEAHPGGVCLHRGCIPSKALLHVAGLLRETRTAETMGLRFGPPEIDLARLRDWKDAVVNRLTGALGDLRTKRGIAHFRGRGRLTGPRSLDVALVDGGRRTLTFDHAILATGSRPADIPNVTIDSPRVMDSTRALALEEIPARLLIIGGGVIGLELGSVYAALGSRVTVVEATPGLLPGADRDLVRVVARALGERIPEIHLETRVDALEVRGEGLVAHLRDKAGVPRQVDFDRALVAVGRRPNSDALGLEAAGVTTDARGLVTVDGQLRTSQPHIFAIGDLTPGPMLAHKASHQARVAVEAIAGQKSHFEPNAIPAVCYTDPELAWAGLTETAARERNIPCKAVRFPWAASGRAQALERPEGLTKLVVDPASERILGLGLVGRGAGDLIAEGVLAMEMGATVRDLAETIHPHPTLSETLMEAAEVFYGHCAHYYTPKRAGDPKPPIP